MIDISYKKNPELYEDYEACVGFLGNIVNSDYEYPKERVKFHVYSEIKTRKELMVIKSYLATQDLDKTEMVIWSDYDISDNPLIQPFKDLVTFNVYDAEEEAMSTPLEGNDKLFMKDPKYYLQSDLARILLLYKYGGGWVDMDIILLRDFKPLLDQEYMYMWGSETDFVNQGACATVLSGISKSEFMWRLIHKVIETPARPSTTCWGKDMFASLYREYEYNIMPASFFNIEWCINKKHPDLGDHIESQGFHSALEDTKYLFLESFAWHWHNSSKKGYDIVSGSKFDLLEKMMYKKLVERKLI